MEPYVTFVVAARNDNYAGNFLHRMQVFVDALLGLWQEHGLSAELVIVEWNPPEDRSRLKEALTWPKCMKPDTVRIVEVPGKIHHRLPNSDRMPMFEYIAKNVGIRRAKGEYVLATNPDLLYSNGVIKFFASERLLPECFYRVDRYDVDATVSTEMKVEQQLRFCRRHSFRVATVNGTTPIRSYSLDRTVKSLTSILKSVFRTRAANVPEEVDRLHTNASGDFFLMARSHWHVLRGYPELKSHSFIDGYICFMAASLGLQQVILKAPLRIYHQEHDRSEHTKRPLTDYQLYRECGRRMLESKTPEILNNNFWGLGNEELVEYWINA